MNRIGKSVFWPLSLLLLMVAGGPLADTAAPAVAGARSMELYKSPSCGCCREWQAHMLSQGFSATVHHPGDLNAVKEQLGIEPRYQSCHTGVVADRYVIEGHVPARYVQQFLENPPEGALGLAVPGMPVGSPGMEMGDRFRAYDVLLLMADGTSAVYAHIGSPADQ